MLKLTGEEAQAVGASLAG